MNRKALIRTSGAFCRVKAVISALDGVLAAEELAGIAPGLWVAKCCSVLWGDIMQYNICIYIYICIRIYVYIYIVYYIYICKYIMLLVLCYIYMYNRESVCVYLEFWGVRMLDC